MLLSTLEAILSEIYVWAFSEPCFGTCDVGLSNPKAVMWNLATRALRRGTQEPEGRDVKLRSPSAANLVTPSAAKWNLVSRAQTLWNFVTRALRRRA